jgi:hypothetical protein
MIKKLYASVLLLDNEILVWRVNSSPKEVEDFYRDFYYSGINRQELEKTHTLTAQHMGFEFEEEQDEDNRGEKSNYIINNYVFSNLAKEYFKLWKISKESRGQRPY